MRIRDLGAAWAAIVPVVAAGMVAASSATAAAAGSCTTWNGDQPAIAGTDSLVWSVAVVSSCDVWTAGQVFTSSGLVTRTLIEHWTGGSWAAVPSPSPGYSASLSAISAVSGTDIWAVGSTNPTPVPRCRR